MSSLGLGSAFFDVEGEDVCDLPDWKLQLCFNRSRHKEPIEGSKTFTHTWRMKERMKTVSVALVLCLNVGVDPPDIVKTQPCARLECWTDPLSMTAQKALETIGLTLQKQYERWQPRARYKQTLDPTTEEVKKLCVSLRRNAKDERVLFHYNGHGVPKPTANGEIWVFNRSYTQYIPLSIYDLQQWMGAPSIYVYDCSCAGLIVESFRQFAIQHDREYEIAVASSKSQYQGPPAPNYKNCVQLAACGPHQFLPMNPDLPADLFTSCLTTPIKVALRCRFVMQNTSKLVPGITLEIIDKIPGQLNDRRTMLGELNWIFTAITDTIAWNVLPKDLFQKLFRQDLLVASLFRNFLLAERIMRSYNCNPCSSPRLPPTYHHPMWQAWDLAVDICLSQLPAILQDGAPFRHSPFFAEQLTAFQVWLTFGSENHNPPEQLPIVLQVLLSQVHRLRALELLGRFLDLGPWAVNLALSVGIFPYVLKLLQSSARELRPLLVFIWAKVLAVDSTCQTDLVRDGGHKYFLNVLLDQYIPAEHRTMAAFVMASIAHNYRPGQEAAMQGNVVSSCLEQINDTNPLLRQWLAICLGKTWHNYDAARWCGARDSAHEKLYALLSDPIPEVRAAAVFALGTFINAATERTDHANTMDHSIGMTLINNVAQDGSPIVRMELVIALQWLVLLFENQFVAVAYQYLEEEKLRESIQATNSTTGSHYATQDSVFLNPSLGMKKVASRDKLKLTMSSSPNTQSALEISTMANEALPANLSIDRMRRVSSNVSLSTISSTPPISIAYASVYTHFWRAIVALGLDPCPPVATKAKTIIKVVKSKISMPTTTFNSNYETPKSLKVSSYSEPSSPSGKASFLVRSESPPANMTDSNKLANRFTEPITNPSTPGLTHHVPYQYSAQFSRTRKLFDKGPSVIAEEDTEGNAQKSALVETEFIDWCSKYFSQSVYKFPEDDPESANHQEKEWRYMRNAWIRKGIHEEQKRIEICRLDDQVFINKNPSRPYAVKFHPYESTIVVSDKDSYSVWDWEQGALHLHRSNNNVLGTRISSMDFINPHDSTLLLTGTDDGAVRVWRNCFGENTRNIELVTAFQAVPDMTPSPRGSGLVVNWEQHSSQLAASGEIRVVRLWDLEKETKVMEIPTGAESCVTSLSSNAVNPSLLVAGCGDGSIRVFDRRLSPHECRIMTMREHVTWVITVRYLSDADSEGNGKGMVYSGSVSGDLKFWDIRQSSSLQTIHTSQGMTAMAIHPNINILACGSVNQCISIFNSKNGEAVNIIKYHDGFMGQRIGPISCLGFHPYRASLAAGSTDSFVSVYSVDRRH